MLLPPAERAKRCTGSTAAPTEERRNAIIGACVHLGTRRVAAAFGVSREVVRALRNEAIRDGKLDHLKEEMGRRALGAADAVLDRLIDEVDSLPRASLAITYGILKDKGLLLTGQPTARVEHVQGASHQDLNDWIASLPAAAPVIEGESPAQKGHGLPASIDLAEVDADTACDIPSPVCMPTTEGANEERAEGGHSERENGGAA
jgi:hypothetical protein